MGRFPLNVAALSFLMAALSACAPEQAQQAEGGERWIPAWVSAQQIPEPHNTLPDAHMTDATLRQLLRAPVAGTRWRVRFSNAFGTEPLRIEAASIARARSFERPAVEAGSLRALTFAGAPGVVIPPGADWLSDPVDLDAPAFSGFAVSAYFRDAPARQTGHPGSRTTSYVLDGDQTAAVDPAPAATFDRWHQISGVEVVAPAEAKLAIAIGDSITDGRGTTTNGNDRWTDVLAERLAETDGPPIIVLNQGIGGNRLLNDGLGPNTLARLDRDVLAQPGARYLIVLIGVNDLGTFGADGDIDAHVDRMIAGYGQIVARARARGVVAVGGTITPFGGSFYDEPAGRLEPGRRRINDWIRAPGNFDAVVDFDAAIRDPERPDRLNQAFDSGDGLHPSPAGYRAMAEAVPLSVFDR